MTLYFLDFVLLVIGIYALVAKRHVVKKILGVAIMEYSVNFFLILIGFREAGVAPILTKDMDMATFIKTAVDPLPQALVLTSIVIGLGTLALMVSIAIRLYERYGTFDMHEINRLRG
ncbi:NADH-quinone oxidoreductase subunit K [candidate division WOR-3 bacterium]|nr:NADH-quinone oxidoreductase subunit K [candidate division WOR-3 bacterium]